MSQAAARASKREIRRAFGPAAVGDLARHDAVIQELLKAGIRHQDAIEALTTQQRATLDLFNEFRSRSLWGRLRWVLRGD